MAPLASHDIAQIYSVAVMQVFVTMPIRAGGVFISERSFIVMPFTNVEVNRVAPTSNAMWTRTFFSIISSHVDLNK